MRACKEVFWDCMTARMPDNFIAKILSGKLMMYWFFDILVKPNVEQNNVNQYRR
jgi:hypothetical protein